MSYLDLISARRDGDDLRQACSHLHLAEQGAVMFACSPFVHLDELFHAYLHQCSSIGDCLPGSAQLDLTVMDDATVESGNAILVSERDALEILS